MIRAVESTAEAAQDLAERLCAVARGGAQIENIPAQAAHVAGDTATAHPRDARLAPARRLRVAPGPAEPALVLRPVRRTALLDGAPTAMTRLEYDLLLFPARHPYQVLSRGQLVSEVWGYEDCCGARTVDVHVRRIPAEAGRARPDHHHRARRRVSPRRRRAAPRHGGLTTPGPARSR